MQIRTSGPDMRNFSELFGTEMGRRAQPITERQELLGRGDEVFHQKLSLVWFKGRSTENHGVSREIYSNIGFSCKFSLEPIY
jgi:hypothetical protein